MAAKGLDVLIQFVAVLVVDLLLGIGAGNGGGSVVFVVVALVINVLIVFGYPAIMEAVWRGRTLGKAAFGLRVLTKEGAPIRFRHALIRSLLFIVDGLLFGPVIGILCLLLTGDTVRLGDMVAGTIVIREKTGAGAPIPVSFGVPYGRESYVAALDVSGLSADDYALVRGFLIRANQLAPEVRYPLAVELATPILHKLRVAEPPMHPEEFLHCVAAAVQRRYAGGWGSAPGAPHAPQPPPYEPPPAPGYRPPGGGSFAPPA